MQALPEADVVIIQERAAVELAPGHGQKAVGNQGLRILVATEAVPLELFDFVRPELPRRAGVSVPHGDGLVIVEILKAVIDDVALVIEGFPEDFEGVGIEDVVLVHKTDPGALCQGKAAIAGIADAAVCFVMHGDDAGVLAGEAVDQLAGAVGGGVVADEEFDGRRGLLF